MSSKMPVTTTFAILILFVPLITTQYNDPRRLDEWKAQLSDWRVERHSLPENSSNEQPQQTSNDGLSITSKPLPGHKSSDQSAHPKTGSWLAENWHHLYPYFVICVMLIVASTIRVFNVWIKLDKLLPESCALLISGILVGVIYLYFKPKADMITWAQLTHDRFFLILLPPIILEAAYQLENRDFFDKFVSINALAIVGTIVNIVFVWGGLMLVGKVWRQFSIRNDYEWVDLVLFSTIVSAVDPIAVLAIFQDLHINSPLYFVVFGESLLNDAVVVTIYSIVESMMTHDDGHQGSHIEGFRSSNGRTSHQATWRDLGHLVWKLAASYLGGFVIGFVFGILTSIVTRFTHKLRQSEPVIVLSLAYFSYIVAELFQLSGIVSLTTCGLIQVAYVRHNLSTESNTTIHNLVEMIAIIDEIIIYFLMGLALTTNSMTFDLGFVTWTTILITIGRFVSVFSVIFASNQWINRNRPVDVHETILVSFSGLRGAVAFSLVNTLDTKDFGQSAATFQTTTLFVIMFTTFVFGVSSKYLALMLKIRTRGQILEQPKTYVSICRRVINRTSPFIELFGPSGQSSIFRKLLDKCDRFFQRTLVKGGSVAIIERDDPFFVKRRDNDGIFDPSVKLSELDSFARLFVPITTEDFVKLVNEAIEDMKEHGVPDPTTIDESEDDDLFDIVEIKRRRTHASPILLKSFSDVRHARGISSQVTSATGSTVIGSSLGRRRSYSLYDTKPIGRDLELERPELLSIRRSYSDGNI